MLFYSLSPDKNLQIPGPGKDYLDLREHIWGTQGIQILLPGLCEVSYSFSHHMLYLAKLDKSNLKSFIARRK